MSSVIYGLLAIFTATVAAFKGIEARDLSRELPSAAAPKDYVVVGGAPARECSQMWDGALPSLKKAVNSGERGAACFIIASAVFVFCATRPFPDILANAFTGAAIVLFVLGLIYSLRLVDGRKLSLSRDTFVRWHSEWPEAELRLTVRPSAERVARAFADAYPTESLTLRRFRVWPYG